MRRPPSAAILLSILALLSPLVAACGPRPTPTIQAASPTAAPSQAPTATGRPSDTPTPETPPAAVPAARFEFAPCPFDLPAGLVEGQTIECGVLLVPENREDPGSPLIRLAVAILHPSTPSKPEPIVYLEGGPGGSVLEFLFLTFDQQFEPLLAAGRDIILFDQRGVGFSEPALDCPGLRELGLELLDEEIDGRRVGKEEALDLVMEEALACRTDLAGKVELSAYNTEASAADVEALRKALVGQRQVNLWGVSYGTWLALEVMRRYPAGIRSVILDSVLPPDRDLLAEAPANAARSIDLLFDTCAADPACDAAFPNLRTVFFETVTQLNEDPAAFEVTNPLTRERYDVLMTGDNLADLLFQFLYASNIIPSLPQILYEASQGTYSAIAQLLGSLLVSAEAVSQGQQFSVLCRDEIAFSSPQKFEAALTEHPELVRSFDDSVLGELGVRLCKDWRVGQADRVLTQPVTSDLPTLILAGEFDPITPPEWGRHVGETLKNSFFYEYPGMGHGTTVIPGCPQQMMVAFLGDPAKAPDDACQTNMETWKFVMPSTPAEVEWVPFTNEAMGIQGLVPKGWAEAQVGTYARSASATDVVALLLQAMPGTAQDLLTLLTQQLGLGAEPQPAAQREANGLVWSLYTVQVQGLQIDFALAETAKLGLVVLLQCYPQEQEALYESVYLPAIDALVPIQ